MALSLGMAARARIWWIGGGRSDAAVVKRMPLFPSLLLAIRL